jgi:putative FmdB family regulatory protein
MPTYDYICDSCGHEFEAFEPITSPPRADCPDCKLPKLRRKIGPGAAILFKGSGFYQTDYRSDSYKKAAKAEKSASEPAKPAAESKTASDTKPAGDSSSSPKREPAKPAATPSPNKS